MSIRVAIDGPAGSGKSSVSKAAARRLGYDYLDTGAAYRAVAWYALENGVDTSDEQAVIDSLEDFHYEIGTNPDEYFVRVNETDITDAIREVRVTSVVSQTAKIPAVRQYLNDLFRHIMNTTSKPGIIAEGRDVTTVIAPDADARILLTASEEARLARRAAELPTQNNADTEAALKARDQADSKVSEFMVAADGVTTVDSTELDYEQTIDAVVAVIQNATR